MFQWRDREGAFHDISQMETRRLLYTYRMLWNHTCAGHLTVGAWQAYTFGKPYTFRYVRAARRELFRELERRQDIPQNLSAEWEILQRYGRIYGTGIMFARAAEFFQWEMPESSPATCFGSFAQGFVTPPERKSLMDLLQELEPDEEETLR